MDILSGILKTVRLEGALFLDAEFSAPWCMCGRYGRTSIMNDREGYSFAA